MWHVEEKRKACRFFVRRPEIRHDLEYLIVDKYSNIKVSLN
jgi:hypothetical protein